MSTCHSCGTELSQQWKFCLKCGAPLGPSIALVGGDDIPAAVSTAVVQEAVPAAIRPEGAVAQPRLNLLAVVALVLGLIGGPVAAIFGHFAMKQIAETGERGMILARVATVLGYVWLAIWVAIIAWVVVVGVG